MKEIIQVGHAIAIVALCMCLPLLGLALIRRNLSLLEKVGPLDSWLKHLPVLALCVLAVASISQADYSIQNVGSYIFMASAGWLVIANWLKRFNTNSPVLMKIKSTGPQTVMYGLAILVGIAGPATIL
jgi:hypothetical protein